MKLHICRNCWIPHFDNCRQCFGFGVLKRKDPQDGWIPVSAGKAYLEYAPSLRLAIDSMACPECGSGLGGIPKQFKVKMIPTRALHDQLGIKFPEWKITPT